MIVGDTEKFAIESGITKAYERLSFRALGYFVIHIAGRRYGVFAPDATMLACSYGEVERRITERGGHVAPFATDKNAGEIADTFRDAIYAPDQEANLFWGIPHDEFCSLIYASHLAWAPDGDEAFDDRSYVLQFDVGDRVRLIGFRNNLNDGHHDPNTLTEMWLDADTFYGTLQQWRDTFNAEWQRSQKIPEREDGAASD